jgi:hypothetical protein
VSAPGAEEDLDLHRLGAVVEHGHGSLIGLVPLHHLAIFGTIREQGIELDRPDQRGASQRWKDSHLLAVSLESDDRAVDDEGVGGGIRGEGIGDFEAAIDLRDQIPADGEDLLGLEVHEVSWSAVRDVDEKLAAIARLIEPGSLGVASVDLDGPVVVRSADDLTRPGGRRQKQGDRHEPCESIQAP